MIRISLSILISALLLAGCNPPASVVAPAPDPTPVPSIADTLKSAVDGSTVIFNEAITAPVTVEGYSNGCDTDTCSFNKLEIQHTPYNEALSTPLDNSVLYIQGRQEGGHGVIITAGTTLKHLWVKGFNNHVLFEQNVAIEKLSLDGQFTGGQGQDESAHMVENAGQSNRCTETSSATELCVGSDYTDTSTTYLGNLEVQIVEVTGNNNTIDLRYGALNHINNNATAASISRGTPGHIAVVTVTANDNEVFLCDRTISNLTVDAEGNTVYISNRSNITNLTLTASAGSEAQVINTTYCQNNAIRP
ncbi:hypothetical protein [Salinibius halmophilus]|uniref:hypothetical protein n=1 Tax=Salinibius halmophilus TaxID=1853216 RepID=UPI000E666536|nr:hypothetical protein [Salinibius halmophilus]